MHRELDSQRLSESACEYDYHQLLDLLLKMNGQIKTRDKPSWLKLKPSDWLSFPAADVRKLVQSENKDWHLEASFFGLYGVDAPTPHYFLQDVTQGSEAGKCIASFLDVFNQNAYWLLHKSWQKFQPLTSVGEENLFVRMCFAISGQLALQNNKYRENSTQERQLSDRAQRVGFSLGALSNRKQSLCVVENILRHALSIPRLSVSSDVVTLVDTKQVLPLGEWLSLGENTLLGSRVAVSGQAVKVSLGVVSLDELEDFKPGGVRATQLSTVLEYCLPPLVSYCVKASVRAEGMRSIELGPNGGESKLGAPLVLGESNKSIEYEFSDQSYKRI
ncbi:type VI secretion system baseplate subunit TssG [Marinomonas balearica]|uniref:Type VI secretion system protein ImpH n=1 Tax=Marinomonas balearica TaxID=491947 RepID=A0A4R6M672_9GAMM|nr:type VI secretion system baseplate subunit TssG [Marinomonas balearica]TDO95529.1 type VI secretion system protein ImpH [Marinomonas balearica]